MKTLCFWSQSSSAHDVGDWSFTSVHAAKWPGFDCRGAFISIVETALEGAIYRDGNILFEKVKGSCVRTERHTRLAPSKRKRDLLWHRSKG